MYTIKRKCKKMQKQNAKSFMHSFACSNIKRKSIKQIFSKKRKKRKRKKEKKKSNHKGYCKKHKSKKMLQKQK